MIAWPAVIRTVCRCWGFTERLASLVLPGLAVQHDGLELCHLRHGGARAFLADPAALQPAVGHQVSPPQRSPVDVDAPSVDLPDGPDHRAHVGGEDARAQTVSGAVGLRDR